MKEFIKYVGATITGIVMLCVIMGILGVISLVGLVASTASTVEVEDNSVFNLTLPSKISERSTSNPMAMLNGDDMDTAGLNDIIDAIHKAKNNENVKGIYIDASNFGIDSFASARAIREALADFKKSGKWIVAYADNYSQVAYYVCSLADEICLNPQGIVEWQGLCAEPMFFKDMLAKVGVKVQLCKVGKYKSAPEELTADGMSDANREQVTAYLNGLWKQMLKEVSTSRKIPVDSLNAYADRFMTLEEPATLQKKRMIDKVVYATDISDEVAKRLNMDADDDIPQLTLSDMGSVKGEKNTGEEVVVYYASGEIVDTAPKGMNAPAEYIAGDEMSQDLVDLADDDAVKAVVIRVNSPGGSAFASEQIWHAVKQLKAKKPVVISMGGYAASGGYYISCGADYIYADPTTITGSIGIFGIFMNYSELMTSKLGIKFDEVKTNKHANFGSMSRLFTEEEMAILDKMIDRGYNLFRKRVADGRKMSVAQVEQIAQGRVWLGSDALGIKLVDKLGSLDDAVKKAAQLAKLDDYYTSEYPATAGWLEQLLNKAGGTSDSYISEQLKLSMGEYYEPLRYIMRVKEMSGLQARLPYFINIR